MRLEYITHRGEDGLFWAEIPALPGCLPDGRTPEELARNVREAIECTLESYLILPPGTSRTDTRPAYTDECGTPAIIDIQFGATVSPGIQIGKRRRKAALA